MGWGRSDDRDGIVAEAASASVQPQLHRGAGPFLDTVATAAVARGRTLEHLHSRQPASLHTTDKVRHCGHQSDYTAGVIWNDKSHMSSICHID